MDNTFNMLDINFIEYEPDSIIDMATNNNKVLVVRESCEINVMNAKTLKTEKKIGLEKNSKIIKTFFGLNNKIYLITENFTILVYSLSNSKNPLFNQKLENQIIKGAYLEIVEPEQLRKNSYSSDLSDSELNPGSLSTPGEYLALACKNGNTYLIKNEILQQQDQNSVSLEIGNIYTNFGDSSSQANVCYSDSKNNAIVIGYSNGELKKYNMFKTPRNLWKITIKEKTNVSAICKFKEKYCCVGLQDGEVYLLQTEYGVVLQNFSNNKSFITSIVSHAECVFYTGNDARVFVLEFDQEKENFLAKGEQRGQSHRVNSLICLQKNATPFLLSGGVNTDVCFYELTPEGILQKEKKYHKFHDLANFVFYSDNNLIGVYHNRVVSFLKIDKQENEENKIEVLFRLKSNAYFTALSFCENNEHLALLDNNKKTIKIYNIKKNKRVKEIKGDFLKIKFVGKNLVCFNNKNSSLEFLDSFQNYKKLFSINNENFASISDVDEIILSSTSSSILLTDYFTKKCFLITISSKEVLDISFLLENDNVNLIRFFAKSNDLFIVYKNNNFKKFDVFNKRLFKLKLNERIEYALGCVKEVVFNNQDKNQLFLYSDYYFIFVDLKNLKFKCQKKNEPILFSNYLNNKDFFSFYVNWKDVVDFKLEKSFDTKIFIK